MVVSNRIKSEERIKRLQEQLSSDGCVRVIEAHSGFSALVGQEVSAERDGESVEFDAFWASSLTGTASLGMPDAEILGFESRSEQLEQIVSVTDKPVIVDGDTGGSPSQFEYFVKRLENLGVSGVIIEDKEFPKRNSLDANANQTLEDPDRFAEKLARGEAMKIHDEFMIIARLESLISNAGVDDAIRRAERYIEAGVDGIMIHAKSEDPSGIFEFVDRYETLCQRLGRRPPLVAVPTTYNDVTDEELADRGVDIVIYANHLLRSACKAMEETAETILENGRALEAEPMCVQTSDIFRRVEFDRIKDRDASAAEGTNESERDQDKQRLSVESN